MPTTATAAPSDYLNTAEVSERFFAGLSTQTIRKFVAEDGLPAHRVVRRLYFDPAEVDAWIRARNGQTGQPSDPYRQAIKRLVDEAPELTAEQAATIRAVLVGGAA
ncbi:helix-turn-helix domain-containing protein [Mycobacterium sp.]|uniref:helix-turn-helix domain-containing protein n=1 Tax=Mycobacterium sp. TaxID=1785 RepID=UPI003D6BA4E8